MRASLAMPASVPAAERKKAELPPARLQAAAWYAAFAIYACCVAVFSQPSHDRAWGGWAVAGYLAAALVAALWRSRGKDAALAFSLAGALAGPTTWLATMRQPTPDVRVVSRAATLLLQHGTPYLDPAQIVQQTDPIVYNPYLPFMAVFGVPKAIGLPGLLGDTRFWTIATTLALFALAFRIAGRPDWFRTGMFALATPIVAYPLTVGITDSPVLGMFCVSLALLSRARRDPRIVTAGLILGTACAMKATAWPALPILAVMLATRDGVRAAVRFTATAVATIVALSVAFAPALLAKPSALVANTVLFPLGLTRAQTPARSPLPGHMLAATGPTGHTVAMLLLVAAGLGVLVSLVIWPPRDCTAATLRLAIALTLIFAFSPTTRFGYFTYPLGLLGWLALTGSTPGIRWREPLRWFPWPGRQASAAQPARLPEGSPGRYPPADAV